MIFQGDDFVTNSHSEKVRFRAASERWLSVLLVCWKRTGRIPFSADDLDHFKQ